MPRLAAYLVAKDAEILALHHQLAVLERQRHRQRARFVPTDRALLAALLNRLPGDVLHRMRLVVRPETVLRWHRDLPARHHGGISRPRRPGRPPTLRSIRVLVLALARENSSWGYRHIHGELLVLGIKVATPTVWEILNDAGIDPAPERTSQTWAALLRCQAQVILAVDFGRNRDPHEYTALRPGRHRARHPPRADPGRCRHGRRLPTRSKYQIQSADSMRNSCGKDHA